MKTCLVAFLASLALVLFFAPSVHGAESEVMRFYDEKLRLTEEQMKEYLEKANLEAYGFTKTVEVSTVADENGRTTTKRTIYYKVTDDCSKAMFWESVLDQRLPAELKMNAKKIKSTIQNRISGRNTKSCTIGLEIHPQRCFKGETKNSLGKRRVARGCGICFICSSVAIQYN